MIALLLTSAVGVGAAAPDPADARSVAGVDDPRVDLPGWLTAGENAPIEFETDDRAESTDASALVRGLLADVLPDHLDALELADGPTPPADGGPADDSPDDGDAEDEDDGAEPEDGDSDENDGADEDESDADGESNGDDESDTDDESGDEADSGEEDGSDADDESSDPADGDDETDDGSGGDESDGTDESTDGDEFDDDSSDADGETGDSSESDDGTDETDADEASDETDDDADDESGDEAGDDEDGTTDDDGTEDGDDTEDANDADDADGDADDGDDTEGADEDGTTDDGEASDDGDEGATDDADESDDALDRSLVEQYVHEAVNEERAERDLEELAFDEELRAIARAHSEDMAERGYFAHDDPDGNDFADRYEDAGYECRAYTDDGAYSTGGENIAYTHYDKPVETDSGEVVQYTDERELADGIVGQWMNSDGHRENILADHWNNEGVGIHVTDENEVYATQNFC